VEDLAVLRLARVKQIEASWLDCGFRSSEPGFPYSDLGMQGADAPPGGARSGRDVSL
jgi:hypothetical protein